MAKELYLYSSLHNWSAQALISELNDNMGKEVTMRTNSPGGDVFATWGIMAKMQEHGNVTMQVDGAAFSGAANLTMYAKKVKALDVSTFMFHRADGGPAANKEEQDFANKINADLKSKMLAKIDQANFKVITGVSIEDLFNPETRINVFLTASQMKQLGIVDEVVTLSPSEVNALSETMFRLAANYTAPKAETKIEVPNQNNTMKTLEELKAAHPALYAEAVKLGADQEADRVGAIMVFAHLDPEGAKKIVASGKPMTATQMAEFSLKAMSPEALNKIKAESVAPIVTEAVADAKVTEAAKAAELKASEEKAFLAKAGLIIEAKDKKNTEEIKLHQLVD